MEIKITKKGVWSETETIYTIDDDEIVNLLKRVLMECRQDQVQRLILNDKIKDVKNHE